MHHFIRSIFLFLLLPVATELQAQKSDYQGRLWSITGNGAKDTSYLFGTIHVMDEKAYRFPEGTMEVFHASEAFAMELNMDSVNQMALMRDMMMKDSLTIKKLLNDKEYQVLTAYLKDSLNMTLGPMRRMHPMLLTAQIQMQSFDQDSAQPLDLYFHLKAKKAGKKVIGLETVEEQVNAIQSVPYEQAAEQLVEIAQNGAKEDGRMDELLEAYVAGDLDKLLKITKEQKISKDFEKVFLTQRNRRMADRAASHIKEQSIFIAIGAGHLPGKKGVIEMLRKKGFKVEPVPEDG